VACPDAGDQAENAARVRWAGVGVSVPRRLQTARGLRLAVRRLLDDPSFARRAGELGAWNEAHPGAARAAAEVERLAGTRAEAAGERRQG
jgi:UDP:flavonoid glycosyltransferase YjiC (YdhE family)